MRRRHSITIVTLFGSAALAVMLLLGGLITVPVVSGQSPQVLHVVGISHEIDKAGVRQSTTAHELWFDPSNNDTAYVTSDANGAHRITRTRRGRTATIYDHTSNRAIVNVAETDNSPMLGIASSLLGYQDLLQQGKIQPVEERDFEGHRAIRVRFPGQRLTLESWADKQTLLPLEESYFEGQSAPERITWTYSVTEQLMRDQVPSNVFGFAVPATATTTFSQYMSVAEATAMKDFDTYYLGDRFDNLPLFGIAYRRLTGSQVGATNQSQASLDISYSDGNAQVSLIHTPGSPPLRESAPGVPWNGEQVEVNGHVGALYTYTGGADLDLQIGGTALTIHAQNRQQALHAAAALQRLN